MSEARSGMCRFVVQARIWWIFGAVFLLMAALAPNFLNPLNQIAVLKASSTHFLPAVAFTLVLVTGHLDLSFAAVMTLGGMIVIGFQPEFGWAGGLAGALGAGLSVGLLNGLLVTRAGVHSFIVTLGTLTIVTGVVNVYSNGGTLYITDYAVADWLDRSSFFSPRVLLAGGIVLIGDAFLFRTRPGRNLFMIGGNERAAWHAGIPTARYITLAFVASGVLSALGGALFAMSLASAHPAMGERSLMLVIAAVIIGGTSMAGGRGSVLNSMIAVVTLVMLTNGLSALGAGYDVQLVAGGAILAATVLYDAWTERRRALRRGQRPDLLPEALAHTRPALPGESA